MAVQTTYGLGPYTSIVGNNVKDYFPVNSGWFNTKGAQAIVLNFKRLGQSGPTPTFQVFIEYLYEPNNTFYPLLDLAGAAVSGVLVASGTADVLATDPRILAIGAEQVQGATAGVLTQGNNKYYQVWIPEKIRYRFDHVGTGVTNTYSALAQIHTRM